MARLCENAAIAQPVERILGKDEVASSNLASSSKIKPHPIGWGFILEKSSRAGLKIINATVRWTVAATSSQTGGYINFKPRIPAGLKMQPNLAGTSKKSVIPFGMADFFTVRQI